MERLWYLEGLSDGRRLRRLPLLHTPFIVGRRPGLELTIPTSEISQRHAEINLRGQSLFLRDLNSTNGTFLNKERIQGEVPLGEGDIVHFARLEYQIGLFEEDQTQAILGHTTALDEELPTLFIQRTQLLLEMIRCGAVKTLFQPIVELESGSTVAYEALGRGDFDGLPHSLGDLFALADIAGAERELTHALRQNTAECINEIPEDAIVFLNTHPNELRDGRLLGSLERVREAAGPDRRLVLEIHEAAVTDPPTLLQLRQSLSRLKIGIAYDDFGAGQARILELAEDPPDYLKFDIKMVQAIEDSSESRLKVTESLVRLANELNVATIAEGLETAGSVAVCRQLGFTHGQGYFLGGPIPIEQIVKQQADTLRPESPS